MSWIKVVSADPNETDNNSGTSLYMPKFFVVFVALQVERANWSVFFWWWLGGSVGRAGRADSG